jgi:hypothetical protein
MTNLSRKTIGPDTVEGYNVGEEALLKGQVNG